MLEIAWWNWDDDTIKENIRYFYGPMGDFIKRGREIELK
jgi:hypothetical protein